MKQLVFRISPQEFGVHQHRGKERVTLISKSKHNPTTGHIVDRVIWVQHFYLKLSFKCLPQPWAALSEITLPCGYRGRKKLKVPEVLNRVIQQIFQVQSGRILLRPGEAAFTVSDKQRSRGERWQGVSRKPLSRRLKSDSKEGFQRTILLPKSTGIIKQ